jgi:hypothetical protein
MADISGFPYFEVQFTKQGKLFETAERRAVLDAAGNGSLDELFVVAHGWNNDVAEARALYRDLFGNVRRGLDDGRAPGLAGRRIGVLGVLWPSKKFAEEDLTPGGGASLGGAVDDQTLSQQLDGLKGTFDGPDEAVRRRARSSSIWCARSCPSPRTRPTTLPTCSSNFRARRSSSCSKRRSCPGRRPEALLAAGLRRSGSRSPGRRPAWVWGQGAPPASATSSAASRRPRAASSTSPPTTR